MNSSSKENSIEFLSTNSAARIRSVSSTKTTLAIDLLETFHYGVIHITFVNSLSLSVISVWPRLIYDLSVDGVALNCQFLNLNFSFHTNKC